MRAFGRSPLARHASGRPAAWALVVALIAASLAAPPEAQPEARALAPSTAAFQRAVVARVQAHLARVEARLRAHPPRGLTAAQRRARAVQLDRLAAYRRAGVFPHNHDFAGRRVPYFVDAHGTRCAMAYLIETAGGRDIVRLVSATANNARVVELGAMPGIGEALAAWLVTAGLTIDEAQAIQPGYPYEGHIGVDKISSNHAFTAGITGTACLTSTALNLIGPKSQGARIATPIVGALAGVTAIVVGAAHLDDGGESETLGGIEVGVGGLSVIVAAVRTIHELGRGTSPRPAASRKRPPAVDGPTVGFSSTARYPVGLRLAF